MSGVVKDNRGTEESLLLKTTKVNSIEKSDIKKNKGWVKEDDILLQVQRIVS